MCGSFLNALGKIPAMARYLLLHPGPAAPVSDKGLPCVDLAVRLSAWQWPLRRGKARPR